MKRQKKINLFLILFLIALLPVDRESKETADSSVKVTRIEMS